MLLGTSGPVERPVLVEPAAQQWPCMFAVTLCVRLVSLSGQRAVPEVDGRSPRDHDSGSGEGERDLEQSCSSFTIVSRPHL